MRRTEAIAWVVSVCAVSLRLSQAKALAALAASAMRVERVSLANIGRRMLGNVKHQIKRCWRFCNNDRVEPADAMRGVVGRLVRKRKKPLLVALDWVDVRGFGRAGVPDAGRRGGARGALGAAVLGQFSCLGHTYDGHRSRNAFEESLLLLVLRSMVPQKVKVILLADRGFGRAALAAFCRRQGFSYLIRVRPEVTAKVKGFHGKLLDYPVKKGVAKVAQGRRLPGRRGGHAERGRAVAQGPAQEAGRVLVPGDRPGRHRPPAVRPVRPADDHRAAVPGRQVQAQRLGAAGHAAEDPRAARPAAAGPGHPPTCCCAASG